jgi:tryptophan-rich sensory protein
VTPSRAVILSIAICAVAAALEGACAGAGVKGYFAKLRAPRYSAPLPVWYAIGALYYLTFGFVLYRVLLMPSGVKLRGATLLLVIAMLLANALWNLLFFRARNLFLAFVTGSAAPLLDVPLLICLIDMDHTAAAALVPYLIYRIYAVWWGYALWRANQ